MAKAYVRNSANDGWIEIGGGVQIVQSDSAPASTYPGMLWLDTDATAAIDEIADADGDTKVQCEESADEDIIRMDCAGTEVWKMSAAGERTMPLHPSFLVKLDSAQTDIEDGDYVTIEFDTEVDDRGSDFNVSTYTFTAPVTGLYLLSVLLVIQNLDIDGTSAWVYLKTSNRSIYTVFSHGIAYSSDPGYHSMMTTSLADMDANDTVYVDIWLADTAAALQTDINAASYFSGILMV